MATEFRAMEQANLTDDIIKTMMMKEGRNLSDDQLRTLKNTLQLTLSKYQIKEDYTRAELIDIQEENGQILRDFKNSSIGIYCNFAPCTPHFTLFHLWNFYQTIKSSKKYQKDIEKSKANNAEYTLWCENWEPVKETKVEPIFNIRLREVNVPVTSTLMVGVGKLNIANYKMLKDKDGAYSMFTEIGYIEIGNDIKVAMVPGEFCADLLTGGASLKAEDFSVIVKAASK